MIYTTFVNTGTSQPEKDDDIKSLTLVGQVPSMSSKPRARPAIPSGRISSDSIDWRASMLGVHLIAEIGELLCWVSLVTFARTTCHSQDCAVQ